MFSLRINTMSGGMFSRDMVINIFQTAYEPGHTEAVIDIVEKLHYDVNSAIPSNGLTLFLVNIFFLFFFFFFFFFFLYLQPYERDNAWMVVFTICIRTDRPEQTVWTQMRRRRTRRLIWVYTVCQSSSIF